MNMYDTLSPNLYIADSRSIRVGVVKAVATNVVGVALRSAYYFFVAFFLAIILSKAAFFSGYFV